jgi:hypothetical protein
MSSSTPQDAEGAEIVCDDESLEDDLKVSHRIQILTEDITV